MPSVASSAMSGVVVSFCSIANLSHETYLVFIFFYRFHPTCLHIPDESELLRWTPPWLPQLVLAIHDWWEWDNLTRLHKLVTRNTRIHACLFPSAQWPVAQLQRRCHVFQSSVSQTITLTATKCREIMTKEIATQEAGETKTSRALSQARAARIQRTKSKGRLRNRLHRRRVLTIVKSLVQVTIHRLARRAKMRRELQKAPRRITEWRTQGRNYQRAQQRAATVCLKMSIFVSCSDLTTQWSLTAPPTTPNLVRISFSVICWTVKTWSLVMKWWLPPMITVKTINQF